MHGITLGDQRGGLLALVFGFEHDVVVRIYAEPQGSRIDLRSSSRWGEHDLGANARLIRDFFAELDTAVTEIYGQ